MMMNEICFGLLQYNLCIAILDFKVKHENKSVPFNLYP